MLTCLASPFHLLTILYHEALLYAPGLQPYRLPAHRLDPYPVVFGLRKSRALNILLAYRRSFQSKQTRGHVFTLHPWRSYSTRPIAGYIFACSRRARIHQNYCSMLGFETLGYRMAGMRR